MVLSVTQQLLAATCWSQERIDVIARGATSQMIHTSFDKSYGWQSPLWDSLGGSFRAVAPTIVSWAPERLDTFGLGEITNELMHNAWDGTTTAVWQASWQELSGQTLNGPSIRFNGPFAVATWGPDRLDMFGVGTKDSAMYHQSWNGSQWQADWESHGGVFASNLAVTSWSSNRLDIFGLGTDYSMYHLAWTGTFWEEDWDDLNGTFVGDPAVASWSADRLDMFGIGTDYEMYHKYWDGSSWSPVPGWESLGGVFTSSPAVVSWGPERLDVFGIGTDGAVWHSSYDGKSYGWQQQWDSLGGGPFSTPPVAVSWGPNRLDVFAIAANSGDVYHITWDGSAWSGWQTFGKPAVPLASASASSSSFSEQTTFTESGGPTPTSASGTHGQATVTAHSATATSNAAPRLAGKCGWVSLLAALALCSACIFSG